MAFLIEGIGTAVPSCRARQAEVLEHALHYAGAMGKDRRALESIYRRSGIDRRGSVLIEPSAGGWSLPFFEVGSGDPWPGTARRMEQFAKHSTGLAEAASRHAIERSGIEIGRIARLIVVSCTGFFAPGLDIELIRRLGLRERVKRVQVGFMGCHGALNGLEVARSMALTCSSGDRVLLVAVELCSLHAQDGMLPDDLVANAIFADGAGAVIGRESGHEEPGWRLRDTRSVLIDDTADAMTWRIGDHGFVMSLSATVPGILNRHLGPALDSWLRTHGLSRHEVGSWAVHPGGARILGAVGEALHLDSAQLAASREVLREHGNMSSATVLFVLDHLRRTGAKTPCVALGFGPGLIVEMALFEGASSEPTATSG